MGEQKGRSLGKKSADKGERIQERGTRGRGGIYYFQLKGIAQRSERQTIVGGEDSSNGKMGNTQFLGVQN